MSHAFLEVSGLSKVYATKEGNDFTVYDNVNFTLDKGEFVCIIGHSGCGKSTILNTLAGLDDPSAGAVIMNNKEVKGPSLERGVVFQNYSLLPWLSTLSNVEFGVKARWKSWSKSKVREHSTRFLNMVGLEHALNRKPSELSGGMRQRVSIARAFATQPELLLLDEPFGALDALTRGVIQEELVKIWSETHQTVFMITHDVDEAILLSDRIFLMSNGPNAAIAESVKVDLPRPRQRNTIFQQPGYYPLRNYLVNFLVNRSGEKPDTTSGKPKEVNPLADLDLSGAPAEGAAADHTPQHPRAVNQ
ncbi:ABC transporter ATP-binding protein [Ketobacter sp.]|uniref:ABC transporter ATP-binding protein n=1 Tax=Ketobacter sp. TaxID=2083498 RepID=UPI000F200627|nr:ABC transporter ATP-binding protein [Ketobacter sp.]RLU01294.1 MAG: ABC transporter ATP-binding protein [Ketobacter sp.]